MTGIAGPEPKEKINVYYSTGKLKIKGRGVEILYSEKEEDSSYTLIGGY